MTPPLGFRRDFAPKFCEYCAAPLVRREDESAGNFNTRRFCGRPCKGRAAAPGPDYAVIDCGHTTPCWVWQKKSRSVDGYGKISVDGRPRNAHRVYYEAHVGPIPKGLHLDHLCRNPPCVNPAHLEPVTPAENSRRGLTAKLTRADVAAIRSAAGTQEEIGARFGVTQATVSRVRSGRTWSKP